MKSIYFGGGSWSSAFYIGIIKNLEEKYGNKLYKKFTFSGVSAGAIFAILCSLGYKSSEMKELYKVLSQNALKNGVWFGKMSEYHDQLFDIIIKDDVYKILEKRNCKIGVSRFFHKYVEYKKWDNNDHLRKSLHSSFRLPFYCRYQKSLDNRISYDGGIANNNLNDYDITIGNGKFYDIQMNPSFKEIIYPPNKLNLENQIKEGYKKSKQFNFKNVKKKHDFTKSKINSISLVIFYVILIIEYIVVNVKDSFYYIMNTIRHLILNFK
jgi:hypothetical protein